MTAAILPLRSRAAYVPVIGDEVVCHQDGKHGFVERILENRIGKPALAWIRVQGGFGVRMLSFDKFRRAPARTRAGHER